MSFEHEIKKTFRDFQGLSVVRNCLRTGCGPLRFIFEPIQHEESLQRYQNNLRFT